MKTYNENTQKTLLNFGILAVAFITFALDQVTKLFVVEVEIIRDLFSLTLEKNKGVAFGVEIPLYVTIPLTASLIILGIFLLNKYMDLRKHTALFLAGIVIGGAFGNLFDRIVHGYVIDFISIWKWPVFNLADTFVTIGIFSIIFFYDKLRKINNIKNDRR